VSDAGTSLQLTSPEQRPVAVAALGGSISGTVEAELVPAGIGRPEDFPPTVAGKIALLQRGDLTFTVKAMNAQLAGAAAVIIYNNQAGGFSGQLQQAINIPVASISIEDGQAVQTLTGPVSARLDVKTQTTTATSQNVVARPPSGDCSLVAGGHYDSVPAGPGANDNASGTAVVLEMARTRAAAKKLNGVCYVLFGSEEIGLVGSANYLAALAPDQRSAIKNMLNFDMLAVGSDWPFAGSKELTDLAAAEAQKRGLSFSVSLELPQNAGSDHANFIQNGIPAVIFNCVCDVHYHTAEDKFQYVKEDRLKQAGQMGLAMIDSLLGGG